MAEQVPDKNIEVNGKLVGGNSTIKLSFNTAWKIMAALVFTVMTILTYSYFDLKKDVKESQEKYIEMVNDKVEGMESNVKSIKQDQSTIMIDQATIKGDIKLILDRQNRDNPVFRNNNVSVQPSIPPPADSIQ